jgi:hypothetical protein
LALVVRRLSIVSAGKDWSGTKAEYFTEGNVEARFKGVTKGKPLVISEGD